MSRITSVYLIFNWLRNRNTIEFLGLWEQINNPGFNPIEFDGFKKLAGLNRFSCHANARPNGAIHASPGHRLGNGSHPTSKALNGRPNRPRNGSGFHLSAICETVTQGVAPGWNKGGAMPLSRELL